ncbi:MAG TPA: LysM peptidoglycan-binding domain-containing protein [Puia sp.]|nr:LysM peptidoglycan-binding domain-containing protein [Puia sp.]
MRSLISVLLLFSVVCAAAQPDELLIQGQTGGLYLEHTVAAKETWYSVGRMYNVDAKALAQYNHLTFAHPLVIGETLKVPLTKLNFSQDGKKTAGESLLPVYHIVREKEWLYRISVNHNKVPIPVLEKWNQVTGDQVHAGLHMIVGYLKVKTRLSALAKAKVASPDRPDTAAASPPPAYAISPETEKPEPQRPEPRPQEQRPEPRPQEQRPESTPKFNGGKFKAEFSDGGNSVTGQAGTFKSTSGWQDGKYYALMNNVPVGTIVKITDQGTGKSVFAKVLGQLPDMKESAGLTVRISNAAASELGEGEGKFGVGVSY